ncbi:MAG: hypothetical protein ACRD0C_18435 [Acidimicrobiia bacterium]
MAAEHSSRRRRRKKILRRSDGSLYDVSERRRITEAELRDYVRDGGLFEARRKDSGGDCTYEVLQDVVGSGFLESLVPGMSSSPLAGLRTLAGLAGGGGTLSALSGAGGMRQLADLVGEEPRGGHGSWDDDDWDGPRRSRRSRRSDQEPGWEDGDVPPDRPERPDSRREWDLEE